MKKHFLTLTVTYFSLIVYSQTPQYDWVKGFGGTGNDKSWKITLDHEGNIIVTGRFRSKEIMFDTIKLINSDQDSATADVFIAKYNSDGKVLWAKSFGGYGDDLGLHVATDKKGNIALIGGFDSEIFVAGNYRFTNKTKKGAGSDIFIIKFFPSGEIIWAKSFGGEETDTGYDSCIFDEDGNIFYAGAFWSSALTIDSITLSNSSKGSETYVAKFNPDGKILWAKVAHSINDDQPQSCALDPNGNLIIAGYFKGETMIFDSTTLKNVSTRAEKKNDIKTADIFVAKFSSKGDLQWAKSFGGHALDIAACKTDSFGNIFLAGEFTDSVLVLGNTALRNDNDLSNEDPYTQFDLFVAKLNSEGNVLWATNPGGKTQTGVRNFWVDAEGNSIITGFFAGTVLAFENITLNNTGESAAYIASFSPEGKVLWAKSSAGKGMNTGRSCVTDKQGNIYLTGSFEESFISFDTITLKNLGSADIFIAKLKPTKTK